jgi:hypothetical protein
MPNPNLRYEAENLNPFSAKGVLTFGSFAATLFATILFNLFVYLIIKGQLISVRVGLDVEKGLILFGIWFACSLFGFMSVTNAFIKRLAYVLDEEKLGGGWRSLIRIALLSPVLGLPLTIFAFFFFPGSPVPDVRSGASRAALKASLLSILLLGVFASIFLPSSLFGLERGHFRESMKGVVELFTPDGKNPIPSDELIKPAFAIATPGLRYLSWLASDFLRTRLLFKAIEENYKVVCDQRLGFMEVEVQDCFFNRLRKMSSSAPMVSPYFALFYETEYRKRQSELVHDQVKNQVDDMKQQLSIAEKGSEYLDEISGYRDENAAAQAEMAAKEIATQSAMMGFANSLLLLSNQLELVEVGPMFIERKELSKPSLLLRAFGSPELPFIEFGQDAQRYALITKLLPIFDFQLQSIELHANKNAGRLGGGGVVLKATLHDTKNRIAAIKRDPLAIGSNH